MRYLLLLLLLTGCGPSYLQIERCERACKNNGGTKFINAFWFTDNLCHCKNSAKFDVQDVK